MNTVAEANYQAAIVHCANSILPMHIGERVINKIFGRAVQSHAAGLIVIMYCEAELGLGQPATLSALQAQFGKSRTLANFVGLLKVTGFVKTVDDRHDRRNRLLVPAPQLVDGLKLWMSHHLRCAEIANADRSLEAASTRLLTDDGFSLRYLAASRMILGSTRQELKGDHAWAWFDGFDCGDRIALMLLNAHFHAVDEPGTQKRFKIESRSLARQLGISHSHVRNIINQAEQNGYLHQDRERGEAVLSTRFLDEARDWHLMFWSWLAEAASHAGSIAR